MKKINFAIIGCGDVTEKKSGPAFQKIEGSTLYAVMRRNEKKLIDYAKRHGVERYSTNYLDLLEDENIDAIYIATPPHMHHFYTIEAAKHGKAIYVEKPMARTVEECREMVETCAQHGVDLFVAYYRRGQEKFNKIKTIIDSNQIGTVQAFNLQFITKNAEIDPERSWLLDKEIAGGGKFYDVGSHMIDMLLYLFGDVQMATGLSVNQSKSADVNDNTSGIIQFKNGTQGTIQFAFNGHENLDKTIIVGSDGHLEFSMMENTPVILYKDGQIEEYTFEPLEHVQMPFIERVVQTLLEKDQLEADGLYGLRTQEILETLDRSETITYS